MGAAAPSRQELLDLVSDAISDSIDMDWTPTIGARYVVEALIKEGLVQVTAAPTSEPLEAPGIPQPPWPIGSTTNCKREGWRSYFAGVPREPCPFPPDYRHLQAGYREGWDAAAAHRPKDPTNAQ